MLGGLFEMGERLIQRYGGQGKLIFQDNEAADVIYRIDEFQAVGSDGLDGGQRSKRGRVSHAEGHPDWHPITTLHRGPCTLVLDDGRKLKVLLEDSEGWLQVTGDFF
jgi:hypothetical protein